MKKRFIGIILATVTALTISVYAGNIAINNAEILNNPNTISTALQKHNLDKYFGNNDNNENISAYSLTAVSGKSDDKAEYDISKAIQCYSIFDVMSKQSVYNSHDDVYSVIVPVVQGNETVGFATIKEGITVKEAKDIIDKKDYTTDEATDILKTAAEREGQLYVYSINKLGADFDDADLFFNHNELVNIAEAAVTEDITDEKYVHIVRDNLYAYIFKAGGNEYMIPYDISVKKDLENGKVYEISEAIRILCTNY